MQTVETLVADLKSMIYLAIMTTSSQLQFIQVYFLHENITLFFLVVCLDQCEDVDVSGPPMSDWLPCNAIGTSRPRAAKWGQENPPADCVSVTQ